MIERIKLLLSVKNLSPAQLALGIGVQRSGISHILSGRNKPSLDFVMKILEAYPEINESWLLMGNGEMLKSSNHKASLFIDDEKTEETITADKVPIPGLLASSRNIEEEVMEPYKKKEIIIAPEEDKKPEGNAQEPKNKSIVNSLIQQSNAKKMIQLIAIYEDDSFKIFHSN